MSCTRGQASGWQTVAGGSSKPQGRETSGAQPSWDTVDAPAAPPMERHTASSVMRGERHGRRARTSNPRPQPATHLPRCISTMSVYRASISEPLSDAPPRRPLVAELRLPGAPESDRLSPPRSRAPRRGAKIGADRDGPWSRVGRPKLCVRGWCALGSDVSARRDVTHAANLTAVHYRRHTPCCPGPACRSRTCIKRKASQRTTSHAAV